MEIEMKIMRCGCGATTLVHDQDNPCPTPKEITFNREVRVIEEK